VSFAYHFVTDAVGRVTGRGPGL